ncbi:MAG: tetratricopeptide repeat protein, partial [Phycisphaerales bacterium]|nr:tetratricopeptide repeat protein [Phycisphaerales bacterium]
IAPTVLALLGLPAAADMPGRVLVEALDGVVVPERIGSWESVPGECGMHPPGMRVDPADARAALDQLVKLGYVAPLSHDEERAQRDTVSCNQFNLAQSCADARQHRQAIAALDALDEGARAAPPAMLLRAQCLLAMGDSRGAREALAGIAAGSDMPPALAMLRALIDLQEGRTDAALDGLRRLHRLQRPPRGVRSMLTQALVASGRFDEAEPVIRDALAEEPEDARALCARAELALARGDEAGAIADGLAAASLAMDDPRVHFVLGRAFAVAGSSPEAERALEACIALAPSWLEPRALLDRLRADRTQRAGGEA